jgi:hypothetical protein
MPVVAEATLAAAAAVEEVEVEVAEELIVQLDFATSFPRILAPP